MSPTVWYLARSAGIVAYLLLSGTVLLGVGLAGRARLSWPRFAVEEIHRYLAILTGIFIVLHGSTLFLDTVVSTGIEQLVVPFTSAYRPFAVGLGVCAAELVLAVGLTTWLRPHLPHRVWRTLHYLALPAWLLASLHGILAGTDRFDPWFAAVVAGAVSAVLIAAAVRFRPARLESA